MASKQLLLVLCFSCHVLWSSAVIFRPCEVAEAMTQLGQKKALAANWVCLAKFVSGFNSNALGGPYADNSYDFGVFQINDKYCKKGTKESCGVSCTELASENIMPSAKCALKIYQKDGFEHWKTWKSSCQNIDTSRFISKCSLRKRSLEDHQSFDEKLTQ